MHLNSSAWRGSLAEAFKFESGNSGLEKKKTGCKLQAEQTPHPNMLFPLNSACGTFASSYRFWRAH